MAYRPLLNTLGDLPDQHIPHRAAAHPGDRPEDDRLQRADPQLERLPAPVTANRLSPAASSTSIALVNRVNPRLNKKAINPPAAATAR